MLKNIVIKNFKSYSDQTLSLGPLTLMIGANASGKSNALEAFRFLSWLSQGQKLSVLKHRVDDSEQVLRGQLNDLGYLNCNEFTLGCQTTDGDWNDFQVTLTIREQELHITQEKILGKGRLPLYKIRQASEGLHSNVIVDYNNFSDQQYKPSVVCTDQITILNQLESPAGFSDSFPKSRELIPKIVKSFQHLLENTLFLDPIPSLMRGDSFPDKQLRGDCSNLSGVLFNLWQQDDLQPIIDSIKSLPEQDITNIKFHRDRRGKIAMELVESFGGVNRNWSIELISDGTLRVLAIAAALLSAPEGATIVIEEVDNGVHPSRAKQLLQTMREQASTRNIRLLLTTHNPALMDALPDEALADVVFCYRDPLKGDSRLIRLADLQDYAGLVSQGPLGELVTHGIIDRFIKSPRSPEQKKKNALDWLARVQGDDT